MKLHKFWNDILIHLSSHGDLKVRKDFLKVSKGFLNKILMRLLTQDV